MPNMDCCMFEVAADSLEQIIDHLSEIDTMRDLNCSTDRFDRPHIKRVHMLAKKLVSLMDDLNNTDGGDTRQT